MESMLSRSLTAKKSRLPYAAMLKYYPLALSIRASVSSASFCFSLIYIDLDLEADNTLIAFSSDKIFSELLRISKISYSICFKIFLFYEDSTTNFYFYVSRSGLSFLTSRASSWSVSPYSVIMKLIMTT